MTPAIGFDVFASRLAQQFDLAVIDVRPDAVLVDHLQFDSFDTLLLVLWLEETAGLAVPFFEVPELVTVQDAYGYYDGLRRQVVAERAERPGS